ncbi:loricrin-like [Macrobrachium rosenbergii]|uniref:loricrin-like n=1 Tax=Macrobrachium rosenbergii TaxID=79674 RepID=UPI0034D609A2
MLKEEFISRCLPERDAVWTPPVAWSSGGSARGEKQGMSVLSRPLTLLQLLLLMATSFVQLASCKPAPIVGGGPSREGAKGPHPGEVPPSVVAPRALPEGSGSYGSSPGMTSGANYDLGGGGGVPPSTNSGPGQSSSSSSAASLALASGTSGLGGGGGGGGGVVPPSANSGLGPSPAAPSSSSSSAAASLALAQAADNNNNKSGNYDEGEGEGFGGGPGGNAFSAAFSNGGRSPSAASIAFSGSPSEFFNSGAAGFLNFSFG